MVKEQVSLCYASYKACGDDCADICVEVVGLLMIVMVHVLCSLVPVDSVPVIVWRNVSDLQYEQCKWGKNTRRCNHGTQLCTTSAKGAPHPMSRDSWAQIQRQGRTATGILRRAMARTRRL